MNEEQIKEILQQEGLAEGTAAYLSALAAGRRIRNWVVREWVEHAENNVHSAKAAAE